MIPYHFYQYGYKQAIVGPAPPSHIAEQFFVSEDGTGDGSTSATPMNLADFELETLGTGDSPTFNRGDRF